MISVVIPFFAEWEYIESALRSIENQQFKKLEIVVIDDSGGDSSRLLGILKKFKDIKIVFHKNKINIGLANSRNIGINISSGKYICFLDSDDEYFKGRLINQFNLLEKNDYLIVYGNEIILKNKEYFFRNCNRKFEIYNLINNLYINLSTLLISKKFLLDNKIYFVENSRYGEDLEFLILLRMKTEKIYYMNQYFSIIKRRNDNHRNYKSLWREFEKKEKQFIEYLKDKFFINYHFLLNKKIKDLKMKKMVAYKLAGKNKLFRNNFSKCYIELTLINKIILLILYFLPSKIALIMYRYIFVFLKDKSSYKKISF